MLSCCEFTGVQLSTLLDDCGFDRKNGKFVLAEGADGSGLTRTHRDGARARRRHGRVGDERRDAAARERLSAAPRGARLQGVSWVKWLRRIEVGDHAVGTKDEALHYVDLMPDGTHRQYSSIQECKSVITAPSGGQVLLDKGFYNVTGLAWSGRGKVTRVDVSFDGGRNWRTARLESRCSQVPHALQHRLGVGRQPAILQSRAIDETGYVQPKINQLREVRGRRSIYHNNAIQSWKVAESGEVSNVQVY
jgi:sulfane dehydrogenase subunit SoxC